MPSFANQSVDSQARRRESLGLALGFVGVVIFGGTVPFTRLAVLGLDPWFIAFGRAALAALLAACALLALRARRPTRAELPTLLVSGVLLALGFPGLVTFALQFVPATHGAIVIGVLPLATAVAAAIITGERPSALFWTFAVAGAALVIAYALRQGGIALHVHDMLLLGTVACAAVGYVLAANLSKAMPGWAVISWSLLLLLPATAPVALMLIPAVPENVPASAWTGFVYVSVFSMLLGFFAWNAGLALGGVARVSQVQLLQTFVSLAIAWAVLGEALDLETLGFAAAVVVVVFLGRKARVAGN